jgi:hypothetical protein
VIKRARDGKNRIRGACAGRAGNSAGRCRWWLEPRHVEADLGMSRVGARRRELGGEAVAFVQTCAICV